MNLKQLSILLVLLVVVGIGGLMVYKKQSESAGSSSPLVGKKMIGDFPLNEVQHIFVQHGTNSLNLIKKNDRWRVQERGDYPANYSEISEFLIKLNDIKVVQSEEVGPSQLGKLWLAPGSGTNSPVTVEFRDGTGKPVKTLLLGKKHMRKSNRPSPMGDFGDEGWPDGRYVMVGANAKSVALISESFSNIEPKPEAWLNKDFFKIEKPRSIAVTFSEPTNSWKLLRETEAGQWTLVEAKPEEQLDTSKVSGVTNPFSSPSFNDIQVGLPAAQVGLDKPVLVNVETFDNFNYAIRVGTKTNDAYPLMVAVDANLAKQRSPGAEEKPEEKEKLDKDFQEKLKKFEDKLAQEKSYASNVYLVSSWSVDSILKERSQLLTQKTEKKDESATATPDKHPEHAEEDEADSTDFDAALSPK